MGQKSVSVLQKTFLLCFFVIKYFQSYLQKGMGLSLMVASLNLGIFESLSSCHGNKNFDMSTV